MSSRRPQVSRIPSHQGRYLVRHPLWRTWLWLADTALDLMGAAPKDAPTAEPGRVLLCVGGHLGDAVLATVALSELARALPGASIGVASGSWNSSIFEKHPRVRWFHAVDHWRLNRSPRSLAQRWMQYRRSRSRALHEMRAVQYDAAIDLYPYYPNLAPVLAAAGIPSRTGYESGGYAPLFTRREQWTPGRTVIEDHRALLRTALPSKPVAAIAARAELPRIPESAASASRERLGSVSVVPRSYAVLHCGAGLRHKQWPIDHWSATARELATRGIPVVLTGLGAAELVTSEHVRAAVPQAISFVDQLSWDEFRWIIANARVVVSADTVASHLAAADGVPTVAIVTGIEAPGRWGMPSDRLVRLTHAVPCAPCYRSRGCREMSCVRSVHPDEVLRAASPYLSGRDNP